jgi:L-fuculose-phosphate aldolase
MADRRPEEELRSEVVRVCRLLHEKNYLAAADGNVSVRLDERRFLVTPTGVIKAFLSPLDLIEVDLEGNVLSGTRKPTGELSMHLAAYRARPDIECVVHAHPPTCIALSLFKQLRLQDVLPEVTLSIGRLEVVPYARPLTVDLAEAAAARLAHGDALILERHGTLTVGPDLLSAYALTERLEHASQVLWLANVLGRPPTLPNSEAQFLRDAYRRQRHPPP